MTSKELEDWYLSISVEDWYNYTKEIGLSQKAKKFLEDIAYAKEYQRTPTTGQLKYAYNLVSDIDRAKHTIKDSKVDTGLPNHISARVAWHDNKWNGTICNKPAANSYCTGEYSLLSRRLREGRDLKVEDKNAGQNFAGAGGYLPPCYWSINAFGADDYTIEHKNPEAGNLKPPLPNIKEALPANSVFVWPFKLSTVQGWADLDKYGKYYPEKVLNKKINTFFAGIVSQKSVVFLYTNFDNPISGNDQVRSYAVVGAALADSVGEEQNFSIDKEQMKTLRGRPGSENFPRMSQQRRISLAKNSSVRLPYHEYLALAQESGSREHLDEIKVVVTESELQTKFAYSTMDMDADYAIYLLLKIRKSLLITAEHNLAPDYDANKNLAILDTMLAELWQTRGYLPGFVAIITSILGLEVSDIGALQTFVEKLKVDNPSGYPQTLHSLMTPGPMPPELKMPGPVSDLFMDIRENLAGSGLDPGLVLRLACLNLTHNQFHRIIHRPKLFAKALVNPYILYEEYEAADQTNESEDAKGRVIDGPIGLFKIDIAYFPLEKFLQPNLLLTDFFADSQERVRAVILDALKAEEARGNCYLSAGAITDRLKAGPLFYGSQDFALSEDLNNPPEVYRNHLLEKLELRESNGTLFYYLFENSKAEKKHKGYH